MVTLYNIFYIGFFEIIAQIFGFVGIALLGQDQRQTAVGRIFGKSFV